jgi:hypothetical protein
MTRCGSLGIGNALKALDFDHPVAALPVAKSTGGLRGLAAARTRQGCASGIAAAAAWYRDRQASELLLHRPTTSVSMEIEPPSTPSIGKVIGSPTRQVPRT